MRCSLRHRSARLRFGKDAIAKLRLARCSAVSGLVSSTLYTPYFEGREIDSRSHGLLESWDLCSYFQTLFILHQEFRQWIGRVIPRMIFVWYRTLRDFRVGEVMISRWKWCFAEWRAVHAPMMFRRKSGSAAIHGSPEVAVAVPGICDPPPTRIRYVADHSERFLRERE